MEKGKIMDSLQNYNIRRFFKKVASNILFFFYRIQAKHTVDRNKHQLFIGECTYTPWVLDSEFSEIQSNINSFTLVDLNKQYLTYSYIKQLSKLKVEGDYLEVGVWRGGLSALVGMTFKKFSSLKRTLYLADTYEGMPKTVSQDNFYKGGELADTSEYVVEKLFKNCGVSNVKILKGYFPQDTINLINSEKFAYIHVDVDIYESAKNTFNWAWPKVSQYGMIVFDDYGYSSTEGVTKFIDEYVSNLPDALFIFNMGGQAVVIKCPIVKKSM
jgi:O-methyltransferase